jgi:hypothetical protein
VQRKALKYRCKVSNAELYQQMSTIHNAYTDVWNLREIYHEVHSNKCESLNGFIKKFLPKHKHYCRTIVNWARTYLAIGLDSSILVMRFGFDTAQCCIFLLVEFVRNQRHTVVLQEFSDRWFFINNSSTQYHLPIDCRTLLSWIPRPVPSTLCP